MSKELIAKAEQIRDEVRVGANTAKRVGGVLEEMAREVNGLYENVLDWIGNEKPQGGGFILTQSDVVNNLTNESQLKPLSAMQGKILKTILDSLVVDNMVTDDDTKALSARQGKNLSEEIKGLSDVYQPLGNYQAAGDYADAVHVHTAAQVMEQANKRFMTDAERGLLSSLGTNAAMKDFSNVTSQSLGQNGYCKFPNGLLIQWGYTSSGGSGKYIYMPMSFYDTNYSVVLTTNSTAVNCVVVIMINSLTSISYFKTESRLNDTSVVAPASEGFHWHAIGRWK